MRKLFLPLLAVILCCSLNAQSPQFAVVRPDGTTFICPSWDSAYNKSVNGDFIYLPGGVISYTQNVIAKKLFIYGAGHHPDSTNATGVTTFSGSLKIAKGADEGLLEGVNINGALYFGTGISGFNRANVQFYTIKRCRILDNIFYNNSTNTNTAFSDSLPSNLLIAENIFQVWTSTYGVALNNLIAKNIITLSIFASSSCTFSNNIFLAYPGSPIGVTNCTFTNNIFLSGSTFGNCPNNFFNNLKVGSANFLTNCLPGDGNQSGNISVSGSTDIFIFHDAGGNFSYSSDFRLKPTCPGINAGTDGTDVGIYGTTNPTSFGWVPSNPHIYFKSVAPQSNSSGQLPIQFKVRTNN